MAYDEYLAERLANLLKLKGVSYEGKKMMGGLTFMVDGKMCVGVHKEQLMVRIDPEDESTAVKRPGASPMKFTGRPMKGFIFIDADGVDMDKDLEYFVDLALKFNPQAKASKKKQKK